jgi:hypothetical protein
MNQEEIWKDIKGYEGIYKVSNYGRVINVKTMKVLSGGVGKNGYDTVNLHNNGGKTFCVHRLVAESFIPNPCNKKCVNHKDGDKLNNNAENLEWNTHSENNQHAYDSGLKNHNKLVLDTSTGVFYYSAKDAAIALGLSTSNLNRYLNGVRRNKTTLIYA